MDKISLPYSISAVLKQQQKLLQDTPRQKYIGRQLTDQDIKTLAIYFQWKCDRSEVPLSFFLSSLDTFRYRTIDEQTLQQFLIRLPAILAAEKMPVQPVEPWFVQDKDEWIPFEVMNVEQKEQAVYLFRCRALGSRMVGHEFDYRVSTKMAFRMASRAGFNQRSELKRLADPRQFVDLRLILHIAKGSSLDKVKVLDCGEHSATVAYNQKINKLRDPEFRKCPFEQRTTCFRCGIGKDQCTLAVTQKTNAR